MGREREATAIIAGWLDHERRDIPAPPQFLALTRKICRETMRMDLNKKSVWKPPPAQANATPKSSS